MKPSHNPIIFALDYPSADLALQQVAQFSGSICTVKVGMQLFYASKGTIIEQILDETEANIFLDLKLFDIPTTVHRALESLANTYHQHLQRISLMTIALHQSIFDYKLPEIGIDIVGVTVLTSAKPSPNTAQRVYALAEQGLGIGCKGVVCSGHELETLNKLEADYQEFYRIVPGIRLADDVSDDDQQRIITPHDACAKGATHLVIGRPLRNNPQLLPNVLAEAQAGIRKRHSSCAA